MARYSKYHSNYILSKVHQNTKLGKIWLRDWVTIGSQHQIEKGKKPYYSDTNFLFTDNSYPSYHKKHNFGKWVAHWVYDDVKDSKEEANKVKVNTSSNDIRDFAYYGSAVELVKSSVSDIINRFPASTSISVDNVTVPDGKGGFTPVDSYKYVDNPFNLDFIHTLSDKEKETNNPDRFLAESYENYLIDGNPITKYEILTRKFVYTSVGGNNYKTTTKYVSDSFTFNKDYTEEIGHTIVPKSLVHGKVELIGNKIEIPDLNYVKDNATENVTVETYTPSSGDIVVDGQAYHLTNPDIRETEDSVNTKNTISGYGFRVIGSNIQYNGNDILNIRRNVTWSQNLGTVTLNPGYYYKVGNNWLEAQDETTTISVTYYVRRNENEHDKAYRYLKFEGFEEEFPIFENGIIKTTEGDKIIDGNKVIRIIQYWLFGYRSKEETGTPGDTLTLDDINLNGSKQLNDTDYTFNGKYKFIVWNASEGRYIDDNPKDLNVASKKVHYNEGTNAIAFEEGVFYREGENENIYEYQGETENNGFFLGCEDITDSNFNISFVQKNEKVIEGSFIIHPCFKLNISETGNYYLEVNGQRYGFTSTCYKSGETPTQFTPDTVVGIHGNNFFIGNRTVPITGNSAEVLLYKENVTYPVYTFIQCAKDGVPQGCYPLDCKPSNWMPKLSIPVSWDVYVKDCSDCTDGECYVPVLMSKEIQPEGKNENMALYEVTVNDTYKFYGYIKDGEEVILTDSENAVITPKREMVDEFFNNLDGFEKQLLTLDSKPVYSNSFLTPIEGDLTYKYVYRNYTWPSKEVVYNIDNGGTEEQNTTDKITYHLIDIGSEVYAEYLSKLLDMAGVFDELWCDNLYKNMTHESIKNFDWTYTREYNEGDEEDNIEGGNRMQKLIRVYGRFFDDIKRNIDGIKFSANNTYDGNNNEPDAEISDRLETSGWDITSVIPNINDNNQGYINKETRILITKEEWSKLDTGEQANYEPAYYDENNVVFLTETEYNDLEEGKERFMKYYPALDLTGVTIDKNFITDNNIEWFGSLSPENLTCTKAEIDFMKKLLLCSDRIFNTKGTRQSIEMVMGMFGLTNEKLSEEDEPDYEIEEGYYTTEPLSYDEKYETIAKINSSKNYPRQYDDAYSGIPLNDVFIKGEHYIIPYYTQKRKYDGDFVFESKGGWGKMNNIIETEGEEPKIIEGEYMETMSYLHVVSSFGDLLSLNPNSLNEGDIYYVADISTYSGYVAVLTDNVSHFFHLKEEVTDGDEIISESGIYNPQLPESWENVDINDKEGTVSKKARYLNSLISTNTGNNPHVGYGLYDGGNEYREYMEKPFKYSLDEYLLPNDMAEEAENIGFELKEEFTRKYNGKVMNLIDTYNTADNSSTEDNSEDEPLKYYLNRKYLKIINKKGKDNEMFKKYFIDVILKFIMQIIPSSSILILENFKSSGKIVEYGDIHITYSYTDKIKWDGSNSIKPVFDYYVEVTYEDGSTGTIRPEDATINFTTTLGQIDNKGVITVSDKNEDENDKDGTATVVVAYKDKTESVDAVFSQSCKKIDGNSELKITYMYKDREGNTIFRPGEVSGQPIIKTEQTFYYTDGTVETIICNGYNEITDYYDSAEFEVIRGSENVEVDITGFINIHANHNKEIRLAGIVKVTIKNGEEEYSSTAEIWQNGLLVEYGEVVIDTFEYDTIPSIGGTVTPKLSWKQDIIYKDKEESPVYTETVTITNDPSATVTYSGDFVTSGKSGVVVKNTPNTSEEESEVGTVTVTVISNGKEATADATLKQEKKDIADYGNLEITEFTYPQISVKGSEEAVKPTLKVVEYEIYTDGSRVKKEYNSIEEIRTVEGAKVEFTDTEGIVEQTDGGVKKETPNLTPDTVIVDSVNVKVTLHDNVITSNYLVTQGSRVIESYGNVELLTDINNIYETASSVSGSSISPHFEYRQKVVYTDSSIEYEYNNPKALISYTVEGTLIGNSEVNIITGQVTVNEANANEEQREIGRIKINMSCNGKGWDSDKIVTIKQDGNAISGYTDIYDIVLTYNYIPSSGGSVTPVLSYKQDIIYKNGTSEQKEYTGSQAIEHSRFYSVNNLVNTTTGVITKGTVNESSVPEVVDTVSVLIDLNGKNGRQDTSVYQSPNEITYGEIVIDEFSYQKIAPYANSSVTPTVKYRQKVTYSDGTERWLTPEEMVSATVEFGEVTGESSGILDKYTGVVTVPTANRETNERVVIGSITLSITNKGQSATRKAYDIKQLGKIITYYGDIVIDKFQFDGRIPSKGNTAATPLYAILEYSQDVTYSDGSTENLTSAITGGSMIYDNIHSKVQFASDPDGILDGDFGNVVKTTPNTYDSDLLVGNVTVMIKCTEPGAVNVPIATDSEPVYQLAREITGYVEPIRITKFRYDDIPSQGGSVWPALEYEMDIKYDNGTTVTWKSTDVDFATKSFMDNPEPGMDIGMDSNGVITKNTPSDSRVPILVATVEVSLYYTDGTYHSSGVETAPVRQIDKIIIGYGEVIITDFAYSPAKVSGNGGTVNPTTLSYKQDVYYDDGTSETLINEVTSDKNILYTFDKNSSIEDVINFDSISGELSKATINTTGSILDLGNVTVELTLHEKVGTKTLLIQQEVGEKRIVGYGDVRISKFTYPTLTIDGGSNIPPTYLEYSQDIIYNFGPNETKTNKEHNGAMEQEEIPASQITKIFSANGNDITISTDGKITKTTHNTSTNMIVGDANINITINMKSFDKSTNIYQFTYNG